MKNKFANPLFLIGMIGCFTIGSQFIINIYQAFWGPDHIWWTHQSVELPVEQGQDHFQLYISNILLQKHFPQKTLLVVDEEGNHHPVVSKDVRIRVNNWYRVKSRFLTFAVFSGLGFGICITLLTVSLFQISGPSRSG